MKILISTPYYLPNVSGITIYIQVLAEELVKRGHSIKILTSRHDKSSQKIETINGVEIQRMWTPIKLGKGVIMPFFPIIALKEIWKTDIINCHLPQVEAVWMSFWGRIFFKKVILTHHTDLSFWKGAVNKIVDTGVFVSHTIAAIFSNKLVAYTHDYAKNSYFLKHFLFKTESIYPPIKFDCNTEDEMLGEKLKYYKKHNKYVLGFCGRIAKQKGLEILIKSTEFLDESLGKNNYVILLAGPTKVIGERYYEYLIKNYRNIIKNKFVFLDNISREKLPVFYKNIDVLLLPSDDRLESFGWVQIESMLCGTPTVATNLPGMRVPVMETKLGEIFENRNEKDLAKKIIKVLKLGKSYYQKNFPHNLDIFDYKKTIDRYEKLFN